MSMEREISEFLFLLLEILQTWTLLLLMMILIGVTIIKELRENVLQHINIKLRENERTVVVHGVDGYVGSFEEVVEAQGRRMSRSVGCFFF